MVRIPVMPGFFKHPTASGEAGTWEIKMGFLVSAVGFWTLPSRELSGLRLSPWKVEPRSTSCPPRASHSRVAQSDTVNSAR